jgi:MFS family permease
MTVATFTFGMGALCNHEVSFFTVSFIARLLQGVADAIISVTIPAIIANEFPLQQERYLGYVNMSMGAGLCLGPLFGSLVFRWLDYLYTFYFFTLYILVIGLSAVWVLPKRVNHPNLTQQSGDD